MTSAIKRRIAREWLIFCVCLVIGFTATYFISYFVEREDITQVFKIAPGAYETKTVGWRWKFHKSPLYQYDPLFLWFCVSPYLALMLVRSIIWSVNTFRQAETSAAPN